MSIERVGHIRLSFNNKNTLMAVQWERQSTGSFFLLFWIINFIYRVPSTLSLSNSFIGSPRVLLEFCLAVFSIGKTRLGKAFCLWNKENIILNNLLAIRWKTLLDVEKKGRLSALLTDIHYASLLVIIFVVLVFSYHSIMRPSSWCMSPGWRHTSQRLPLSQ